MLQSVLTPRLLKLNSKMISTMPAVSVRNARPSQLAFARSANSSSPTPSSQCQFSLYHVCSRNGVLHAVVGSLLLGIVVLVVGLVQLSPGAEAAKHRYYLLGAGALLTGLGIFSAILRCLCLHWYSLKIQEDSAEAQNTPQAPAAAPAAAHKARNGVESEKPARSVLRSQASITSPRQDPKHVTTET